MVALIDFNFLFSQLQMAAISRNTAAVAQDFHNAGGGKVNKEWHFVSKIPTKTVSKSPNCKLNEYIGTLSIEIFNLNDDIITNSKMCNIYTDLSDSEAPNHKSTIRQSVSPPAKQINKLNNYVKKRKLYDQHNKENEMIFERQLFN